MSVGMKIKSSINESIFLSVSELWYTTDSSQSQVSYLYIEAFNENYRRISYNWSINDGRIISIPSILSILSLVQVNMSECCSKVLYPRRINMQNNEMVFALNTVDLSKERKLEVYNIFPGKQRVLFVNQNVTRNLRSTLTPFVKNNELYFVYSYQPLNVLRCSKNLMKC